MSGDVQPRKRKDKKRKKDDLGVEEPRGTAAVFGEGDVFIHSQHDHGTGGHWCAKIIFFSLLAVLITLIGLIILENRGITELEANSVESRYSGVLEGWLEDVPDDDHHDEHTLELNHPDDENSHGDDDHELDHNENDDHDEEGDDNGHNEESNYEESDDDDGYEHTEEDQDDEHQEQQDDEQDEDHDIEESEEDIQEQPRYRKYFGDDNKENYGEDNDENDDLQTIDENDSQEVDLNHYNDDNDDSNENDNDVDNDKSTENTNDDEEQENYDSEDDEDEEHEEEEEDTEVELERIERELPDEEPISTELPALPEEDFNDDKSQEVTNEIQTSKEEDDEPDVDEDFLEAEDDGEPPIERITIPAGKPYVEVEEEASSEQPPDTLTEEEEYERQQEELRREKEKSSHMWLKLSVGGALLVATHAVIRRATAPRDEPATEERSVREETPLLDRRMTLIPEESRTPAPKSIIEESSQPMVKEIISQIAPQFKAPSLPPQEEIDEEEEKQSDDEVIVTTQASEVPKDKELYSDEEEIEEEDEEEVLEEKETVKENVPKVEENAIPPPEPEQEEDPDDVEIIDDEQLEEELEEEEDDISDVDDVELLTRLEAKYGRLPEPERPGQKHKDGGNSIEDQWPGEPNDPFWRQELDSVEDQLQQEWLG